MALVLIRKDGERIMIGKDISIAVERDGARTKVKIDAPRNVPIKRAELVDVATVAKTYDHTADALMWMAMVLGSSQTDDGDGYVALSVKREWLEKAQIAMRCARDSRIDTSPEKELANGRRFITE